PAQAGAGNGARVGAERAADTRANQLRQRVRREIGHRLALPVGGGAEVERDTFRADPLDDARVTSGGHAVSDPLNTQRKRLLDIRRIARLARVAREPQAGRAGSLECRPLRRGRVANLVAGEIEPDDALAGEPP